MTDPVMLCFLQGFDANGKEKTDKDGNSVSAKEFDTSKARDGTFINGKDSKDVLAVPKEARLQVVKNKLLLRKSRSSGNFASAGAKSAPTTPAGSTVPVPPIIVPVTSIEPLSQPCSPGPQTAIHRSPSHSIFTNRDKSSLKHLSTSTPAMTAQAQVAEPPTSPKLAKEAKVPATSKARQKKFHRHFPAVDEDEKVLNYYSCALIGDILLQGHLYITKNYFAFYSNVFGYVTKLLIPMLSVEKITKEKTARIIPNAVGISTSEDKHVFGSLMSRDSTYRYMTKVWELAKDDAQVLLEPEIVEPLPLSDTDSSETREGESGPESPVTRINPRSPSIIAVKLAGDKDSPGHKDNHSDSGSTLTVVLKEGISKFTALPKQSLVLIATTLLLILLFLSAAILLYRIGKIQNRYQHFLPDSIPKIQLANEEVYNEILQWQTQLHSKSASAVDSFLDSNLDQIAKVRQSLEALSMLLVAKSSDLAQDAPSATSTEAKDTS